MVYEVEVKRGRMEPVPWWVSLFYAADRLHCSPWELVEGETPRAFWHRAAVMLTGCENDAREFFDRQQRHKK